MDLKVLYFITMLARGSKIPKILRTSFLDGPLPPDDEAERDLTSLCLFQARSVSSFLSRSVFCHFSLCGFCLGAAMELAAPLVCN